MIVGKSRGVSTSVAVAVVVVVLAVAMIGYVSLSSLSTATSTSSSSASTGSSSTSSSSTTSAGLGTYADSAPGLQLRLSINTSRIYQGGVILANLSEFNEYNHPNNVSKGDNWQAPVALGSCPNTNFWPFGVAVYKGHVTSQNISQGTQIQVFPVVPCPLYIRLITAYVFEPNSHMAQILPGTGLTAITVTASITNATSNGSSSQSSPLPAGSYTLVGGDEWGALAFLYFQVVPRPS